MPYNHIGPSITFLYGAARLFTVIAYTFGIAYDHDTDIAIYQHVYYKRNLLVCVVETTPLSSAAAAGSSSSYTLHGHLSKSLHYNIAAITSVCDTVDVLQWTIDWCHTNNERNTS